MQADEAIVLAGGRGTRLQPLVSDVPKPLAPVAGRPFLAWLLDHLARSGMRRIILATGYMSDTIERAIGHRWQSMDIDYSVETCALGTGGAVRLAGSKLRGGCAHVLNGDTFLEYSPDALVREVVASGASIGIALARVDDVSRYGAVECEGAMVSRFCEKGGSGPGHINAGCYFLTQEAFAALPEDAAFSLEAGVLEPMAASGRVVAHTATRRFIDIGVPQDYLRAQILFGTTS